METTTVGVETWSFAAGVFAFGSKKMEASFQLSLPVVSLEDLV